jgi:hypothetical protein
MADRQRQTFKSQFHGMNTREPPDALPPGKWPLAVNIRADGESKVRTRPGYVQTFNVGGAGPITDIGSYASLKTDSKPRILVHDTDGKVFLDTGTPGQVVGEQVGQVGEGGTGASIIPFRPSASPQSWAYIGNGTGYEKFSAPGANNQVIAQKVGIREPQPMPEAVPEGFFFNEFTGVAADWTLGGNASGLCDATRLEDLVVSATPDPADPGQALKPRYYIQVTGLNRFAGDACSGQHQGETIAYQQGMTLVMNSSGGGTLDVEVEDVFPPIQTGDGIWIQSIYYFENQLPPGFGIPRRCIIVPSQLGLGTHSIMPDQTISAPASALQPSKLGPIAGLRRGSLIHIGAGVGQASLVENVTIGPNGQVAIETTTRGVSDAQVGDAIQGVVGLAVADPNIPSTVGQTFVAKQVNFHVGGSLGFAERTLPVNPFNLPLGDYGVPQENDLFHISLSVVGNPLDLVQVKISFDVDDGSFTKNTFYYPITASLLQSNLNDSQSQFTVSSLLMTNKSLYNAVYDALRQHGYNAASVLNPKNAISINPSQGTIQIIGSDGRFISINTPLVTGVGQYAELAITLSSLIRTGNDESKTLADCKAMQIAVVCAGSDTPFEVGFGSIWLGGGGQPDVGPSGSGSVGSPYYYRTIGRSSLTGAMSNPTPATRYGVLPRTQPVWVTMPTGIAPLYDPQIDTWDIYRYGGAVTSWRYVGSAKFSDPYFLDNLFDSAALADSALQFTNFEPWPTVDQPWQPAAPNITSIQVVGTLMNVFGTSFPDSVLRWLPGTLFTLNLNTSYTLWNRPIAIAGGIQFRFLECAGAMTNPTIFVGEPIVANQPLPYLWGPDASGFMFGCGDPFRPGAFQTSNPNNPDSTPNNAYDLTPPSEPLLGGQIMDGLSLIASSKRWWMLQPIIGTMQAALGEPVGAQWNPVEMPTGRGLAAPYAHTTDGKMVYFWAKDGIMAMVPNQPGQMLTNDIGNLFPQGESGITHGFDITYAGYTIWAPDYRYAASFRLSVMNYILRAHYRDCSGKPRTLVCDMTPGADGQLIPRWSVDEYTDPMVASFQPIQPPATLLTTPPVAAAERYQELYYVDTNGGVWQETDLHNDGIWAFISWLSTPEFDGGDSRVRKDWMDSMVDMLSPSGGHLQPVANGQLLGVQQEIDEEDERTQILVPVGEEGPEEPPHRVMDATALGILFTWADDFTKLNPNPDSCPIHEVVTTLYEYTMEFVPQPVQIKSWESIWTNCGLDGYWFIYRMRIAYQTDGDDPVHLKIDAYDRNEPEEIDLPGTNGRYVKTEFVPTFNKFLMAKFHLTSEEPFALIEEDTEIVACQWGRTGLCTKCNGFGGNANP